MLCLLSTIRRRHMSQCSGLRCYAEELLVHRRAVFVASTANSCSFRATSSMLSGIAACGGDTMPVVADTVPRPLTAYRTLSLAC